MKKYFPFFILLLSISNIFGTTVYDSTLVKIGKYGETRCDEYELNERTFLIMTENDSIVLVQDSAFYWTFDSAYKNVSKNIFTLDNSRQIISRISQIWQDSAWLNQSRSDNLYFGNSITYTWSIADSLWNFEERFIRTISNDTIYNYQQIWDSLNNIWNDYYISEDYIDSSLGYSHSHYYFLSDGVIVSGYKFETWFDTLLNSTTNITSYYDTIVSSFIYENRDSTVLNSTGNTIYKETQSWDAFQWINNVREEHFVFPTYRIDANYVGNGISWDNVNKIETYLNGSNLDSVIMIFSGNVSVWNLDYQKTYAYNVNNKIDTVITYQVDSLNTYTNYERNTKTYTITNKPLINLIEVWDGINWTLSFQDSSWYDGADTLIGITHSNWNGINWHIEWQEDYIYNSYFPLSYTYLNSNGYFEGFTIRYDSLGRLLYRDQQGGAGMSGHTESYSYYPDNSYSYSYNQGCTMGGIGSISEFYYFRPFTIQMVDSVQVCVGEIFSATPSILNGSHPITFLWEPNYNISSTSILNPDLYPSIDTTYQLTIHDSIGNISSHSINLKVNFPTVPTIGDDTLICLNTNYAITIDGSFTSYLWQDGSTNNPYSVNSSVVDTILLLLNTIDTNSCASSDSATVIVSVCTNLNDFASLNDIIIYPSVLNQGQPLSIKGKFPISSEIIFYNFQGWSEKFILGTNGNSFPLNAPSGILLYRISNADNEISTGKIVVLK